MGISIEHQLPQRILVVDDEPVFIEQTRNCLEKHGYEVVVARNGKSALDIVDREQIDLVLLDIIMPVLNGVEVTKILKRNPATKSIPIIVISSMTEYKERVEFFRLGANDYMPKPIDNGELISRVELQLQVVRLRREVELANDSLLQKNRMLEQHVARIEHDLAIARSVQRALLPEQDQQLAKLSIHFQHQSCENLGSDFLDYTTDEDGTVHFVIADVSGHGIASALLASQIKVLFLGMDLRNMSPREFVSQMNTISTRVLIEGYYFTCIYLQYDPSTGLITLVNAGHVPLLMLEKATGKVKQVESNNSPIGFFAGEKYHQVQLRPAAGDVVLVFTDGLTERTNANNEMFEVSRVARILRQEGFNEPQGLISALIKAARDFGASPVFSDDLTVGVIRLDNGASPAAVDDEIEVIRPAAE